MHKAVRSGLRVVVSIMLLGAVALANASGNNVKNTNREHHSRFSKLAFWRGHRDHNKTGRTVANGHRNRNEEHHSRISKLAFWRQRKDSHTSIKTAQASHPTPKSGQVETAQTKPAPHALTADSKNHKQARSAAGKAPAKTSTAPTKAKPHQTAESRTTASLKQ